MPGIYIAPSGKFSKRLIFGNFEYHKNFFQKHSVVEINDLANVRNYKSEKFYFQKFEPSKISYCTIVHVQIALKIS